MTGIISRQCRISSVCQSKLSIQTYIPTCETGVLSHRFHLFDIAVEFFKFQYVNIHSRYYLHI